MGSSVDERWLYVEAKYNLLKLGTEDGTLLCKETVVAARKRFIEGVEGYADSKPEQTAVDVTQTKIQLASECLQALQTKLQFEMAVEVKTLQAEKESLEKKSHVLQKEETLLEAGARLELARVLAQAENMSKTWVKDEKAKIEAEAREEVVACQICMVRPRNVIILPCSHGLYGNDCLVEHRKASTTCPLCRSTITGSFLYRC